jgi:cell division protein FtsX
VRDFTESLGTAGVQSPLEYITREQALDREIEKNPAILEVLSGENPLPDVIVVSLQGVNTDIF